MRNYLEGFNLVTRPKKKKENPTLLSQILTFNAEQDFSGTDLFNTFSQYIIVFRELMYYDIKNKKENQRRISN